MYKVGLTGNFYSGYNEVAEIFEAKGVPVFDADVVLKFMLNYSEKHVRKIKEKFGNDIYKMCLLDTKMLNTNKDFDKLLDVVELDLIKSYEKWRIKNYNSHYTIFKSSILFERKINTSMNFNISVFRPKTERRRELTTFTSIPPLTIDNIIDNEMDELQKNGKSDYVIHNYGISQQGSSEFGVEAQINNINKALIKKGNLSGLLI